MIEAKQLTKLELEYSNELKLIYKFVYKCKICGILYGTDFEEFRQLNRNRCPLHSLEFKNKNNSRRRIEEHTIEIQKRLGLNIRI
jgi:hypothetical protein